MADRLLGLPKFWSTGIAKVLVGEQPCELSQWLPAKYDVVEAKRGDEAKLGAWKINHAQMLRTHSAKMRAEGWKTDIERYWKVKGNAAELSGKVDIVAQATDRRPVLVDTKGGRPRDSDVTQVLIYMVMLPIAWHAPHMIFDGQVVYDTHTVTLTPRQAEEFKPKLFAAMKRLGSDVRPEAHPSRDACMWCSVGSADCPVRFQAEEDAKTELF